MIKLVDLTMILAAVLLVSGCKPEPSMQTIATPCQWLHVPESLLSQPTPLKPVTL